MHVVKGSVVAVFLAGMVCAVAPIHANYILTPVKSGTTESSVTVLPGGTFAVDYVLSSSSSDTHNSAVFQSTFSEAGLTLQSYLWQPPYTTGTSFDDSTPNVSNKGGGRAQTPTSITATTFGGGGAVDVELSNVLDSGTFGSGNLVTLYFEVPIGWAGSNAVTVGVVPEAFNNGFTAIPTSAGSSVTVNIVPEPSSLAVVGVAGVGLLARRRSRLV